MRRHTGVLCALAIFGLTTSAAAQDRPDFSGEWTIEQATAPARGGGRAGGRGGGRGGPAPDMGSGWGRTITITQDVARLTVEYVFFSRGDLQPPLKYHYALDGSETTNTIMMGRGMQEQVSTTSWQDGTLVITTVQLIPHPETGQPLRSEVRRRLSLDSAASLTVETTIAGVLGGPATTTRAIYTRT